MSEHTHHPHSASSPEEAAALLKYMAHHNLHHAGELAELAASLHADAAADVLAAAELLRQAGEKLESALKKTEG